MECAKEYSVFRFSCLAFERRRARLLRARRSRDVVYLVGDLQNSPDLAYLEDYGVWMERRVMDFSLKEGEC